MVVVLPFVPVSIMEPFFNSLDKSEIASIPATFENIIPGKLLPLPEPNLAKGPPTLAKNFPKLVL